MPSLLPIMIRYLDHDRLLTPFSNHIYSQREKLEQGILAGTERFMEEQLLPAREAKRHWQRVTNDKLIIICARCIIVSIFDRQKWTTIRPSKSSMHSSSNRKTSPISNLPNSFLHKYRSLASLGLFVFSYQSFLLRFKHLSLIGESKANSSSLLMPSAISYGSSEACFYRALLSFIGFFFRMRDFHFLKYETEMMMEFHDNFLNAYSHYFAVEEFLKQMKDTLNAKQSRFKVRYSPLTSSSRFFLFFHLFS